MIAILAYSSIPWGQPRTEASADDRNVQPIMAFIFTDSPDPPNSHSHFLSLSVSSPDLRPTLFVALPIFLLTANLNFSIPFLPPFPFSSPLPQFRLIFLPLFFLLGLGTHQLSRWCRWDHQRAPCALSTTRDIWPLGDGRSPRPVRPQATRPTAFPPRNVIRVPLQRQQLREFCQKKKLKDK